MRSAALERIDTRIWGPRNRYLSIAFARGDLPFPLEAVRSLAVECRGMEVITLYRRHAGIFRYSGAGDAPALAMLLSADRPAFVSSAVTRILGGKMPVSHRKEALLLVRVDYAGQQSTPRVWVYDE